MGSLGQHLVKAPRGKDPQGPSYRVRFVKSWTRPRLQEKRESPEGLDAGEETWAPSVERTAAALRHQNDANTLQEYC